MLDLNELEQFVTFAKYGTLSKTAEILNISQPTITRTMQHIEEAFAVTLFERGKSGRVCGKIIKRSRECDTDGSDI